MTAPRFILLSGSEYRFKTQSPREGSHSSMALCMFLSVLPVTLITIFAVCVSGELDSDDVKINPVTCLHAHLSSGAASLH